MRRLVLVEAAQADLRDIARYTGREWGEAQKRRYLEAIRKRLAGVRRRPGLGAPREEIGPGYRSTSCGRHVIFYRETEDAVVVLRILHARMDVGGRLGAE
ncbi:MAG: type II toxin-antitoxin system RelE/ParE family toxin [Proteobacteria bacterium]|nr:type II toxin-antitoxin system RelE/ParE family toxin [Pseudomonadota bacterium]